MFFSCEITKPCHAYLSDCDSESAESVVCLSFHLSSSRPSLPISPSASTRCIHAFYFWTPVFSKYIAITGSSPCWIYRENSNVAIILIANAAGLRTEERVLIAMKKFPVLRIYRCILIIDPEKPPDSVRVHPIDTTWYKILLILCLVLNVENKRYVYWEYGITQVHEEQTLPSYRSKHQSETRANDQ